WRQGLFGTRLLPPQALLADIDLQAHDPQVRIVAEGSCELEFQFAFVEDLKAVHAVFWGPWHIFLPDTFGGGLAVALESLRIGLDQLPDVSGCLPLKFHRERIALDDRFCNDRFTVFQILLLNRDFHA